MILAKLFGRTWIPITALVLVCSAACVRLGIWQLDRLAQRRAFNEHVKTMEALPPLELPAAEDLGRQEYRAVRASGTYDFEHQIAIRNQTYNGEYGYHLVTPLHLAGASSSMGGDSTVLVDRGWIPAGENATPSDWRKYDVMGPVTVSGVIRLSQVASTFGGLTDPTHTPGQTSLDFWVYLNIEQIGRQLPYAVLPVYVDLDPSEVSVGHPIPQQETLDLGDGPHQGYAIQWFSFAALLIAGYPVYVHKQEGRRQ